MKAICSGVLNSCLSVKKIRNKCKKKEVKLGVIDHPTSSHVRKLLSHENCTDFELKSSPTFQKLLFLIIGTVRAHTKNSAGVAATQDRSEVCQKDKNNPPDACVGTYPAVKVREL